MKRNIKSSPAACMTAVKASLAKNAGIIIGYTLATLGMTILQNVAVIELLRYLSVELVRKEQKGILLWIGVFFIVYVTAAGLKKVSLLLKLCFIKNISVDVEQDFIRKYSSIRYRDYYFEKGKVLGQIRGNGINAVGTWCELLGEGVATAIAFLVSTIYLSSIHFLAVFMCIAITGLFLLLEERDNRKLPAVMEEFNDYMKEFYTKQWEQIHNHQIAGFLNLNRVLKPYRKTTDQFMSNLKRMKIIFNRSMLFATFGTDIIVLLATLLSTFLFSENRLELGGILALLLCVPKVSSTLFCIPQMRNSYEQSMSGMRTLNEVYERAEGQPAVKLAEIQKITELTVENLSFHYLQQNKMVLDNFNGKLPCGIHLLKGASGCGKSTLLRILAGELPICSGTLWLGQQAFNSDSITDHSEYVEYMSQMPVIIRGTVRENILMGKEMEQERFYQAVHRADLEKFLAALPGKEQTEISHDVLSSGEKQKIAIARVFYQEKPVWIFDEPVSALDPAAIHTVMKGMAQYASEKIILLSSHQPIEDIDVVVHSFEECMGKEQYEKG